MCLIINKKIHPDYQPIILEDDMEVFKIITKENQSAYEFFQYNPKTAYFLNKSLSIENNKIHEGFHSFLTNIALETDFPRCSLKYFDFMIQREIKARKIVKFIIPKNSTVFYGDDFDIVSTEIKSGNLEDITDVIDHQ